MRMEVTSGQGWLTALIYAVLMCLLFMVTSSHHVYSNTDIDLFWTNADILRLYNGNDISDYARQAHEFYLHGRFPDSMVYSYRFWPPGIYVLHLLPMIFGGENAPIPLYLSIVSILEWTLFLTLAYTTLRAYWGRTAAFIFPPSILCLPEMHEFVLRAGVLNSDSHGTVMLGIAMLLSLMAWQRRNIRYAMFAGVGFALSAYLRAPVEKLIVILTILALIAGIWQWWRIPKAERPRLKTWVATSPTWRILGVILFTTHVVMVPFRLHNLVADHRISWSGSMGLEIVNNWLIREPDHWIARSGGTAACRVDPITCNGLNARGLDHVPEREMRKAYWRALAFHPWSWMMIKFEALRYEWIEDYVYWRHYWQNDRLVEDRPAMEQLIRLMRVMFLGLLLLLPLLSAWRYFRLHDQAALMPLWLNVGNVLWVTAMVVFVHLESRYFFPVRMMIFVGTLIEVAQMCAWKKRCT